MLYPDYGNNIVNIPCSVLRRFGLGAAHPSLPRLDALLEKGFRNIVVMLFDGMGADCVRKNLPEGSFLARHMAGTLHSVFPPTTTAATTSVGSGLTPLEHGWLGWSLYFRELDKIVDIFPNTVKSAGEEPAAEYNVAERFLPYENIVDRINGSGGEAWSVSPFGNYPVKSLPELAEATVRLCGKGGSRYIYTYWPEPDGSMHEKGCYHEDVKACAGVIDAFVERICGAVSDTLVIVTADHGMTGTSYKIVGEYPALKSMLERPVSMEARAAAFHVKEECRAAFPGAFAEVFGDGIVLLGKEEACRSGLFGSGAPHREFGGFIGDFLAVSVAGTGIVYHDKANQFVAHHAGLTPEELEVPFIAIET